MPPVISVRDLVKTYIVGEVEVRALRGVSLDVQRGEFVSVTGPSGSGKSTLMHILGCLDRPTSGIYSLDGQDVSQMTKDQLAEVRNQKIGFVFQGFNLLSRTTALDNVELPLLYRSRMKSAERHRLAMEALTAVGLETRADHHPNQLSGGQQQRVAIARALITKPSILLADEPTGNLDSRTSIEVMGIFQRLNVERGITVLLITHESDIAEYGTRIIRCRDGLIVSDQPVGRRRQADDELRALPQESLAWPWSTFCQSLPVQSFVSKVLTAVATLSGEGIPARAGLDHDVALAAAGDGSAFERLYQTHVARIHSLTRRMLGSDHADEVTQDIFVRTWQKLGTFRGDSAFSTWLHRLALNVVIERRRSFAIYRGRMCDDPTALDFATVPPARADLRVDFDHAIERLPPGAREIFVLHDVEGYKHREIAELLDITSGTSKRQLHRARMLLREQLGDA
jgi:putative ABC transport system ATP-binding protein